MISGCEVKSEFFCLDHNVFVTDDILKKRCTHVYHNFAVCDKHLGSGWRIVAYSD